MVSSIEQNDLHNPVQLFIRESSKSIRRRFRRRSMYRELLFLAIIALGREKISYGEKSFHLSIIPIRIRF